MFHSTKTWGHEQGLSCVFRQWRATHSHCKFLHGYAISVKLTFACVVRDERGWVMDFGGLKTVKEFLQKSFDHKLVVAESDPQLFEFKYFERIGLAQLTILPEVGCEEFARYIGMYVQDWLSQFECNKKHHNLWLHSCEVAEHGGNSAIWIQE